MNGPRGSAVAKGYGGIGCSPHPQWQLKMARTSMVARANEVFEKEKQWKNQIARKVAR